MRSIRTYIQIIRDKGLNYAFRETWRTLSPISYTRYQIRYLKKNYSSYIKSYPDSTQPIPKIIWVSWLQGVDTAPLLVQDCVKQIYKWAFDYDIRIVTSANMKDYVDIPKHILQKLQKGIITYTHFSDILRIYLLAKYGGIWMDATVLLTQSLPDYVTQETLFFFQKAKDNPHPHVGSSWFIAAAPAHPVIINVTELLNCYWQKENKLRDYYLFHDFVTLVMTESVQGRAALKTMPYVSNVLPHTYTKESFQVMPIHKLSYKHAINYHLYI